MFQKTTVPFLDDIKFDPKNLRSTKVGPSNSQSADASSAPLPGAGGGAFPYLRNIFI